MRAVTIFQMHTSVTSSLSTATADSSTTPIPRAASPVTLAHTRMRQMYAVLHALTVQRGGMPTPVVPRPASPTVLSAQQAISDQILARSNALLANQADMVSSLVIRAQHALPSAPQAWSPRALRELRAHSHQLLAFTWRRFQPSCRTRVRRANSNQH